MSHFFCVSFPPFLSSFILIIFSHYIFSSMNLEATKYYISIILANWKLCPVYLANQI